MNHDSTSEIRAMIEERGLSLKKRWGQNFLVNRGARERIVGLLAVSAGQSVWEIGPGFGSMTEILLPVAGSLSVFEVDRGLCRYLEETFGSRDGFRIVPGDFMDTWRDARREGGAPVKVMGNLPYRSASLMIASMVEEELRPSSMVFTVQKELADRMTARPREKSYSSFTVLCRSCFDVANRGDLRPGSFYPVPEVASSVVELRPVPGGRRGGVLLTLSRLARGLFSSRRKTLRNNALALAATAAAGGWKGLEAESVLAALGREGIDAGLRAEEIPPEAYVEAARLLTGSAGP